MRVTAKNTYDIRFRYEFGEGPDEELLSDIADLQEEIAALREELDLKLAEVDNLNGVTTYVSIVNENTKESFSGVAWKHPNDNHCRHAARAEALKSATATLNKAERADVYNAWMNRPDGNGTI